MRALRRPRRMLSLVATIAGVLTMPVAASAEDKVYPPGTDCANQPTIAARLLCGRQEFRRQQGMSVEQPMETSPAAQVEDGTPPDATPAPTNLRPAPSETPSRPRTTSPDH
jgi:hypothetical protein